MPLGASRANPSVAVGFSIALKMATKCSRSIFIQAINRLFLQKKRQKGCKDITILKTFQQLLDQLIKKKYVERGEKDGSWRVFVTQ